MSKQFLVKSKLIGLFGVWLCCITIGGYTYAHTDIVTAPRSHYEQAAYTATLVDVEEEDLPFDNSTPLGVVMNWVVKILLWFIYLTIALIILASTQWVLSASGFWSWAGTLVAAFFYAMIFGRWVGYGAALIFFAIVFLISKFFLQSPKGKAWATKQSARKGNKFSKMFKGIRKKA